MIIYTDDGSIATSMYSVRREGNKLIVDGKALGTMQMDMIFTLDEVLNGLKLALTWPVISFMLLLPCFLLKRCFTKEKSTEQEKITEQGKAESSESEFKW